MPRDRGEQPLPNCVAPRENALKSAHAKSISISGELSPEKIDVQVKDDGIGFNTEISLKPDDMHASQLFGLAGMHERANLIGAEIGIHAKSNQGTQVNVIWRTK